MYEKYYYNFLFVHQILLAKGSSFRYFYTLDGFLFVCVLQKQQNIQKIAEIIIRAITKYHKSLCLGVELSSFGFSGSGGGGPGVGGLGGVGTGNTLGTD